MAQSWSSAVLSEGWHGTLQISRNWADLVKRARAKQLVPDEFMSGTFTISNLGSFGADTFDAILPPGGTLTPARLAMRNDAAEASAQCSCLHWSLTLWFSSNVEYPSGSLMSVMPAQQSGKLKF
jgi:hypothetical protein